MPKPETAPSPIADPVEERFRSLKRQIGEMAGTDLPLEDRIATLEADLAEAFARIQALEDAGP